MRFIVLYRIYVLRIALPAILVELTYCVACEIGRAHARAVQGRKTTPTAGVPVLLKASVVRVPLGRGGGGGGGADAADAGGCVPVTAWLRRARVCFPIPLRLRNRVIVVP